MKINNYIEDGFSKVCDVILHPDRDDQWYYENVDYKFVGPDKKSWLYFIVKGDDIVKCGESGNPLLLETKGKTPRWKKGTFSRLGRYINGCTTDTVIREELYSAVKKGKVSIWARQLPRVESRKKINNFAIRKSKGKRIVSEWSLLQI